MRKTFYVPKMSYVKIYNVCRYKILTPIAFFFPHILENNKLMPEALVWCIIGLENDKKDIIKYLKKIKVRWNP